MCRTAADPPWVLAKATRLFSGCGRSGPTAGTPAALRWGPALDCLEAGDRPPHLAGIRRSAKRGVVERTFARRFKYRRHSKDHEHLTNRARRSSTSRYSPDGQETGLELFRQPLRQNLDSSFRRIPSACCCQGCGACPRVVWGAVFPVRELLLAELPLHAPDPRFADIQFDGNFVSGRSRRAGRQRISPHLWRIRLHKIAKPIVAKPKDCNIRPKAPRGRQGSGRNTLVPPDVLIIVAGSEGRTGERQRSVSSPCRPGTLPAREHCWQREHCRREGRQHDLSRT